MNIYDKSDSRVFIEKADAASGAFVMLIEPGGCIQGSAAASLSRRKTKKLVKKLKKILKESK